MPTHDKRPATPQPGDRCPCCDRERCADDNDTDCQGMCHASFGDTYDCDAHAVDWRSRALEAEARVAALEAAARRVIKYAGEDGAVTPGSTRLDRMLVKLGDLLADTKESE